MPLFAFGTLASALLLYLPLRFLLVRWLHLSRGWRIAASVTAALLALAAGLSGPFARGAMEHTSWEWLTIPVLAALVLGFYLGVATVLVGLASIVLWIIRIPQGGRRWFRRWASVVGVVAALCVTIIAHGEARHPAVTELAVSSDSLPQGFSGTRVALIADTHSGVVRGPEFTQEVVDKTMAAHPDLIVLAGDISEGDISHHEEALTPLRGLSAPLGVYAVSGNHEYYSGSTAEWQRYLESLGIDVLMERTVVLDKDGEQLEITGIPDPLITRERSVGPNLTTALRERTVRHVVDGVVGPESTEGVPEHRADGFTLLLAHRPSQAVHPQGMKSLSGLLGDPSPKEGVGPTPAEVGVDMQMSGHTHGGQLWPFTLAVPMSEPVVQGHGVVDGIDVIVSRGAGSWGPLARFLEPPEIPLVTLTRG